MKHKLIELTLHQLRGNYPDIPLPGDINREELGSDAFFVTLPIGAINARSRNNGRLYPETTVRRLVDQVNENRPMGWWGHPEHINRTETPPAIQWLAASIDDSGTAWGKLIPLNTTAREYFRIAKTTGAVVGNSLVGDATIEDDRVVDLDLHYIDLVADGAWVGVPQTAAKPIITTEMNEGDGNNMPTDQERIAELTSQLNTANARVNELNAAGQAVSELRTLLKLAPEVSLVTAVTELRTSLTEARKQLIGEQVKNVIRDEVKLETLRPYVTELLGEPESIDAAKAKITDILARPHIVEMAKLLATSAAGGTVVTGGNGTNNGASADEAWRNKIAETAQAEAKRIGALK